jgi:hypothetical protein
MFEASAEAETEGPVRAAGLFARRPWLSYLLVLVVGGSLYGQSLGYGFTYMDDYFFLHEDRGYLSDPGNIVATFSQDDFSYLGGVSGGLYYRPMLWVSFILESQLHGAATCLRHGVNVLLHLVTSCLLLLLLTRLGCRRDLSLFLALLFAAHPALVPAVAWIPGRNDSMLAIFVLGIALSLVSFLERERWTTLSLVLVCWALALFTKETAIACAVVVPVLVGTRIAPGQSSLSARRAVLAVGFVAVIPLWAMMRLCALHGFPLFLSKVISNIPMSIVYVGKTFVPIGLSPIPSVTTLSLVIGVVAVLGVLSLAWISRDRLVGALGVGLLWYGGFLFPALLAPEQTRGLEHRLYVPMIGMCIALAGARWPARLSLPRPVRAPLAGALVIAFGALTLARLPVYAGPIPFWDSAAHTSPRPAEALKYLANHYYRAEQLDEAEQACRRALVLAPTERDLHVLLEVIAEKRRRVGLTEEPGRAASDFRVGLVGREPAGGRAAARP